MVKIMRYYWLQKGFTLIEMMITVAIIGILAAIALPSYSHFVDKARLTQAHSAILEMNQNISKDKLRAQLTGVMVHNRVTNTALNNSLQEHFTVESSCGTGHLACGNITEGIQVYYLYALPKNTTKKALWMSHNGKAYTCKTIAAAKARETSGNCELRK